MNRLVTGCSISVIVLLVIALVLVLSGPAAQILPWAPKPNDVIHASRSGGVVTVEFGITYGDFEEAVLIDGTQIPESATPTD